MANSRKNYTDKGVMGRFNRSAYSAMTKEYPFLIGGIIRFFQFAIRSGAFTLRVLLRKNIGKRTFGVWSIVFGYLWIVYFLTESPALRILRKSDLRFGAIPSFSETTYIIDLSDTILYPLLSFIYYILQITSNVIQAIFLAFSLDFSSTASPSLITYCLLFLVFGFIHLYKVNKKNILWEKADSLARGESVFFKWLEGKVINGNEIKSSFIRIIAEPLFIFLCGVTVSLTYGGENGFGLFLKLSAFALMVEEYQEYILKQEQVLDMIDSEYAGRRLEFALDKFNEKAMMEVDREKGDFSCGAIISDTLEEEELESYNKQISGESNSSTVVNLG